MTSSLRRSSRAVSLCERFKFSSQRRLCVLLTTIFRPSVPDETSSPRAYCPLRVLAPPSTGARIVARRFAPLSTLRPAASACQHGGCAALSALQHVSQGFDGGGKLLWRGYFSWPTIRDRARAANRCPHKLKC